MSQESLAEAPSLREGVSLLADPCPGMGFCPSASAVCVEQAVLTPLGCLTAELAEVGWPRLLGICVSPQGGPNTENAPASAT